MKNKTTMADYIHKCLYCQALVGDIDGKHFECSACGFVWEIMSD